MEPYWIITNPDVMYTPGFLKEMVKKSEPVDIGMVHCQPTEQNTGSFEIFLIKDWVIQKIGLFDENFYPAYSEDIDYLMRILNDPFVRELSVGIPFLHGDSSYAEGGGSQTLKNDKKLHERMSKLGFPNEIEYMDKKWGAGWRLFQPFKTPFNKENVPNTYTTYDLEFNRKKYTGF